MDHQLDLEHRLTAVEDRCVDNERRIEKLEAITEDIHKIASSVEKIADKQDSMNGSLNELRTDVETLKAEPGKRWKFVIEKTLYFVVAAVVGFFLAKFGL